MPRATTAAVMAALALAGCASDKSLSLDGPPDNQLLVSAAIDDAASQLKLALPPGTRVFVHREAPETLQTTYLVARLRAVLLARGFALADSRKAATAVLDVGVGALGEDQQDRTVGIPSIPIGVLGSLPDLPLYRTNARRAVVKVSIDCYDPATGKLLAPTRILVGSADLRRRTVAGAFTTARDSVGGHEVAAAD